MGTPPESAPGQCHLQNSITLRALSPPASPPGHLHSRTPSFRGYHHLQNSITLAPRGSPGTQGAHLAPRGLTWHLSSRAHLALTAHLEFVTQGSLGNCHPGLTWHSGLTWPLSPRAHLAFISTALYPACLAMTWASVVLPSPGGPQSRATCGTEGRSPWRCPPGRGQCCSTDGGSRVTQGHVPSCSPCTWVSCAGPARPPGSPR